MRKVEIIIRVLLGAPLWLAYSAAGAVLWVVGVPLVGVLALFEAWHPRPSRTYADGRIVQVWNGGWLTWLWGNEEDGVTGAVWYRRAHPEWSARKCAFMWSALRNPSNNMRFIPGINPKIKPDKVRYRGWYEPEWAAPRFNDRVTYAYTWQGIFSGFKIIFRIKDSYYRFWWGWKLRPDDVDGVESDNYRFPRCGFGLQFKRIEVY